MNNKDRLFLVGLEISLCDLSEAQKTDSGFIWLSFYATPESMDHLFGYPYRRGIPPEPDSDELGNYNRKELLAI